MESRFLLHLHGLNGSKQQQQRQWKRTQRLGYRILRPIDTSHRTSIKTNCSVTTVQWSKRLLFGRSNLTLFAWSVLLKQTTQAQGPIQLLLRSCIHPISIIWVKEASARKDGNAQVRIQDSKVRIQDSKTVLQSYTRSSIWVKEASVKKEDELRRYGSRGPMLSGRFRF